MHIIRVAWNYIRLPIAGLLWSLAWLYPFADGPIKDLKSYALFLIATYTAIFIVGLRRLPFKFWISLALPLVLLISSTTNPYLEIKLLGIVGVFVFLTAISFGLKLRESPKELQVFLIAVLIASAVNSLQGILQWLGLADALYEWMVVPEQRGIAFGTFRQRNLYATFISVGLVSAIWLHHLKKISTSMAWVIVFMFTASIAASGSRTGLLQVFALSMLGVIWRAQRSKSLNYLMLGQSFLLILWLILLPSIAEMLTVSAESSLARVVQSTQDARLLIWQDSMNLIYQRPWQGWGWKEFNYAYYASDFDPRYQVLIDHAHNLPLHLAVEFGLPFAAFLIFLGIWLFFTAYRNIGRLQRIDEKLIDNQGQQYAFAILLIILGIHSSLEFPLWHYGFLYLTGVFVGCLLRTPISDKSDVFYVRIERYLLILTVCLILAVSIMALRQYEQVKMAFKISYFEEAANRKIKVDRAIKNSSELWLYESYWDYLKLRNTVVDTTNAPAVKALATKLLHFSTGPEVVVPFMRSMWLLDERGELVSHADRFCQVNWTYKESWLKTYREDPMVKYIKSNSRNCSPIPLISEVN